STFEAKNAPSSAQDIDAGKVNILLDQWKEVKFALGDDEMHFSKDRIIEDHIRPSAYALANEIGGQLSGLYNTIPWVTDVDTGTPKNNIIEARKILRQNGVPLDMPGMVHLGVDANLEATLLGADFMSSANAGGMAGEETLLRGTLGSRFGVEMFADGSIKEHTSGTVVSAGNDAVGAVNNAGGYAKGAETIAVDGLNAAETIQPGDTFVFAGHSQRYTVTSTVTLSTGAGSLGIYPALKVAVADDEVVTFDASGNADNYYANLMFHRNAFALATAPLQSQMGTQQARRQGIQVENVVSPESNLTLRARLWYDADNSKTVVALDILFGKKTLDPNMGVQVRGDV
ncbi:MAG: hypothetical protein GVY18_05275, partial [Bacteroidetes bacterium]|nr:hypothetical protein [Bacteroidota bacterium]